MSETTSMIELDWWPITLVPKIRISSSLETMSLTSPWLVPRAIALGSNAYFTHVIHFITTYHSPYMLQLCTEFSSFGTLLRSFQQQLFIVELTSNFHDFIHSPTSGSKNLNEEWWVNVLNSWNTHMILERLLYPTLFSRLPKILSYWSEINHFATIYDVNDSL